jgi:hypothetical protein
MTDGRGYGWAIVDESGIRIATVGPTRRSAIVNWLVTEFSFMIRPHHSDHAIEGMWREYGPRRGAEALPVTVSVGEGSKKAEG